MIFGINSQLNLFKKRKKLRHNFESEDIEMEENSNEEVQNIYESDNDNREKVIKSRNKLILINFFIFTPLNN